MSIKIAVFKNGQQIISKVEEMLLEERSVGYFLIKPCIITTSEPKRNEETGKVSFDINLKPWVPLAKGDRVPVPLDWVVTLVEPVIDLKSMYVVDVLQEEIDVQENNIIVDGKDGEPEDG
jgi:hypothetical protein